VLDESAAYRKYLTGGANIETVLEV